MKDKMNDVKLTEDGLFEDDDESSSEAAVDHNNSESCSSASSDKEGLPAILFVDDEAHVLKAMKRFSRGKPWQAFTAGSGDEGLKLLSEKSVEVVVSDMRMPGMKGDVFLSKVKEQHPNIIRILLTGQADLESLENAINRAGIYNYINKPWDDNLLLEVLKGSLRLREAERERIRLEALTKKQNRQLGRLALRLDKTVKERTIEIDQAMTLLNITNEKSKESLHGALDVVTHLLDWNEGRANNHCSFVAEYAVKVAKAISLSDEDIDLCKMAGLLHDIGLMALPTELRKKPVYGMSESELSDYQQHPILGEMAIATSPVLERVSKVVRHHHEYLDGTGFPESLRAKDIDRVTRIITTVADYHDLYHGLLEKQCLGHEDAKQYLIKRAGLAYEADIVKAFLQLVGSHPTEKIKRYKATVGQLKEGMVLDEDLYGANDLLLLTRGTAITQNIVDRLLGYEKKFKCIFELAVTEEGGNE